MKTIGIFTTTRGDIAALTPLVEKINKSKKLKYLFFVGGTHLDSKFGATLDEIKSNKLIKITKIFKYKISNDNKKDLARSLADSNQIISKIFSKYKMDLICLLGDRFEKLSILNNAIIYQVPMFHLCGGEKTEGAIDEIIRHTFTKASHLHFTMCEEYRKNVIKMGEEKKRVFNFGHLSVDIIKKFQRKNFNKKRKYVICTVHPETQNSNFRLNSTLKNIINVLRRYKFDVIFTMPGHDKGFFKITKIIKAACAKNKKFSFVKSLGYKKLFELYNESIFVIGNSSGGLTEVPYFKIPTINIGDRQKGRFMHKSVICCNGEYSNIHKAVKKATSESFSKSIKDMKLHFGDGKAADQIVKVLENLKIDNTFMQKKLIV